MPPLHHLTVHHLLARRHHGLPMHHTMRGSHVGGRPGIRLREGGGGCETGNQSKDADHGKSPSEKSCHEFAASDMIAIMPAELDLLLHGLKGHDCEFAAGVPVFHINDPVRMVHFVRRGTIHLVRHQEDGAALILQRARAGSILAEASVYSDRYHCDARADSGAATWAVARKDCAAASKQERRRLRRGRVISRMRYSVRGSTRKSCRSGQ